MSIEFKLPNLGEGVDKADVAEILVAVGDVIQANQAVLELETEKAVMEVPCPQAGRIARVHVTEGDSIAVGQVLLTIEPVGAAASTSETSPPAPPATSAANSAASANASAAAPVASGASGSASSTAATSASAGESKVVDFALPNLGEGVDKADVAEVLVKVGDVIAANQPVMELETEKAVMEVPCPLAGVIEAVQVSPGDSIRVGDTLLRIRTTSGAAAAAGGSTNPAATSAAATKTESVAPATTSQSAVATTARTGRQPVGGTPILVDANGSSTGANGSKGSSGPPVPAAPSTRRLARKLGVDLAKVSGRGPGGRVTQEDVEDFVRVQLERKSVPAVSSGNRTSIMGGSIAPPPLPDFTKHGPVEREAMNKIARTAAENLTVSWNVIPHVTHHDRADITELEAARKRFGVGVGKNGPKVTMTAIAIKALATCLQAFPKFNSSLDPETNEIVYKQYYNIACAVDTPNGLLVPVVKGCDKKSILEIAADITELATKARDRKLSMDSMVGATCTVTNLGGIGGVAFTPIVNYPEVCILGMSRSQMELQMVDGKIVERMLLPLALSYDHRVINGADAAKFVATLCGMLSDPFQLLSAI
ncbi:MAG: 2-oxo acid dehydrogenase subunit E2 [Planctomycetaceae bacterium]